MNTFLLKFPNLLLVKNMIYKDERGKKFAKDSLWLIISQLIMIIVGIISVFIITFSWGTAKFGVYSQIISLYNIFSILIAFGINNSIIKIVAENKFKLQSKINFLYNNLFITLIQSVFFIGIITVVTYLFPNLYSSLDVANSLMYILPSLILFAVNKNFSSYYTGSRMQIQFAKNRIIRWVIILIGIIITSVVFKNFKFLFFSYFLGELILLAYNIFQFRKDLKFEFSLQMIKKSYKFGVQTYLAELLSIIISNIDVIILGYFLSQSDLGVYSFILLIARTLLIFPNILAQNLNPIYSELWSSDKIGELKQIIKKYGKINAIMLSFQFIILLFIYLIIVKVYKTEMKDSFLFFLIASFGIFISALNTYLGGFFVMVGKNKFNNIRTLILLVIYIISFTFFGSKFQLLGGSFAVIATGILQFIIIIGLVGYIIKSKYNLSIN